MIVSIQETNSKSFQEIAEIAQAVQQTLLISLSANTYLPQQLQNQIYQLQQREAILWGEFLSTAAPDGLPLDQLPTPPQQESQAVIPTASRVDTESKAYEMAIPQQDSNPPTNNQQSIPQQESEADVPSVPQEDTESKAYEMAIPQQDSNPPTNNQQLIPQQDSAIGADSQIPLQESPANANPQFDSIPAQDYMVFPQPQTPSSYFNLLNRTSSSDISLPNRTPSIPQQGFSQTVNIGKETILSLDSANRPYVMLPTAHGSVLYTLIENSFMEINLNGYWVSGYLFEDATHRYYLLGNEGTRYELTAGMTVRFFLAG